MHLNYLKHMIKNYKRNWLFKLKTALVFGFMLIAGSTMAQISGTLTINSASATSGSNYKNFTDLESALNSKGVSGAVTINVVKGSGPYTENFHLNQISGASSTQTITINGNGETLRSTSHVIRLNGTDWITFDNLKIKQTGSSTNQIIWGGGNGCTGITIKNCEIISDTEGAYSGYPGYLYSAYVWFNNQRYYYNNATVRFSKITIENNKLWKGTTAVNGYGKCNAIVISNPRSFTGNQEIVIKGNDIQDYGRNGLMAYYTSGWDIVDNHFHNENNTSGTFCYGMYIYNYFCSGTSRTLVEDNLVDNLYTNRNYTYGTLYGIYAYGYYASSDFIIRNNIVDLKGPSSIYGIYGYGYRFTGDYDIVNNTIIMDYKGTYTRPSHYGMYIYYLQGADIKNNIVLDESTNYPSGGRSWLVYGYNNGSTVLDHNNLFNGNMPSTVVDKYTGYDGSNRKTLANWQSGIGGSNSIAHDPMFYDRAKLNYKPLSIPMVNKGTTKARNYTTKDHDQVVRNVSTPDIGALEYFVDIEIIGVNMVGKNECAPYSEAISIFVKNNGTSNVKNVPYKYSVNGGATIVEVDTQTIAGGATDTFTFAKIPTFGGNNTHEITAAINGDDDVPSNSTGSYSLSTIASASGSNLIVSATDPFEGYYNSASINDPDAIAQDYTNNYDITRPTKYSSSGPGSDYTYSFTAIDNNGIDVSAAGFSYTALAESFSVSPEDSIAGRNVQVDFVVSDANTGCDTTITRHMYIPHVPEPSFDSDDICLGDVAQFKNTSTLKGADYIVTQWEFDDPDPAVTDDNSDIKDGFWKYTTYGNDVYVKMTVANGVYPKFTYFDVDTINITPKPLVDFKVLNACEGSPIVIRNSTTLPVSSTIDYSWDFGGEYTTTGKDPSYTFSTPGQRKISVTATANGCFASLTKNAYQFEMPMAEFTSEGECNFVNVDFINGSTIENGANMGYSWDFDGEGISREINPSFAFAKSGTKSVTLTATSEFGCVNKFSKSIVLQESPEADFAWDAACNLTPINFSITGSLPNGGANSSFEWDFAGESSAAQADPSYLFSKVGSKMVKLTISDLNGCSSSIEKEVNVVLQAVADFEAGSVCEGEEAVFTNKSTVAAGNLTYEWTFGDGASSSDLSPTHSYTDAKSYNVKLKAIVDGGCSDEVTYPVVVNPTPDATFTLAKDGRTVVCDGPQGNDIYRWTFGDGSKDDSEDPTYTFENVDQGTFTVCLATKKGECWNDKCEDITINLAGIENLTQNDDMIIVYPNPTNGKFNVTVENAGEVVVKVGDILGNLLDVNVTDNMNGTYSVDMSVVADGVYFVQVKNGDYFATKRITVSK